MRCGLVLATGPEEEFESFSSNKMFAFLPSVARIHKRNDHADMSVLDPLLDLLCHNFRDTNFLLLQDLVTQQPMAIWSKISLIVID